MTGVLIAALVIAVPAVAFTLWPLLRQGRRRAFIAFPPDAREQLTERKRSVLRALRELEFEHGAGHVSDDDYQDLRARYEAEAAAVLAELDELASGAPSQSPAAAPPPARSRPSAWEHPAALAAAAVFLVVFGLGLGIGIVRYTTPEPPAERGGGSSVATPGDTSSPGGMPGGPAAAGGASASGPLPAGTKEGMLRAARESLFAGRYGDALAAYDAILKREPNNADALAHVGLMASLANHPDKALELLDRALKSDPSFAPALVYRGQVLASKGDVAGAVSAWEKYLAIAPNGEERQRVQQMLADARSRTRPATR